MYLIRDLIKFFIDNAYWLIPAWVIAQLIKEYVRKSKIINDLDKYKDINDVIAYYGTPYDIRKYEDYTKYTFKRSAGGWFNSKYKVDIFTVFNKRIIKHENYWE